MEAELTLEDTLGPLMFLVTFALIFSGYPVAFALGGTALLFAFVGVELGMFDGSLLYALPSRTFGVRSNYLLLAVPFFVFMGTLLERSKLAESWGWWAARRPFICSPLQSQPNTATTAPTLAQAKVVMINSGMRPSKRAT
jgi:hypothetical protein